MGSDDTGVNEVLARPRDIKVHRSMCMKLINLVNKISKIFPEIEASRPRCSPGIKALCSLIGGIEKAKLLIQDCCEGSKLYLTMKGEAILARCKNTRSLLEQSLSFIQNNVPVMLAAEISRLISDLRNTTFSLDSAEEEVGKAMRALLQNYASSRDSMENSAIETIRFAALSLHITSQKALLIERRSIKRLLEKAGDVKPSKKEILLYLMDLLKQHGKLIVAELSENSHKESLSLSSSYNVSVVGQSHSEHGPNDPTNDKLRRSTPPEEFICPISLRLMYDPVIIASGLTFERVWIEKWFDEGHNICPKTKRKLDYLSMTPNCGMKDLILKWCIANGVTIPDPSIELTEVQSLDLSLTSIASLTNSMYNLHLPIDFSQVSLGSLDSNNSVSLSVKDSFNTVSIKNDEPLRFHKYGMNNAYLDKLDEFPWECQCEAVEDVKEQLMHNDEAFRSVTIENFVEPLIRFLKSALDRHDTKAQRTATQLLFAFVSNCRSNIPHLPEDAWGLLASLLDSEVTKEAFAIMELLSQHLCCRPQIAGSGAPYFILKILETQTREFLEPAIKILCNFSSSAEIWSFIVPSEFIPKLVPFIEDIALAGYCMTILKNLCHNEDTRISVAETSGCIASITKLLETGNHEVQEHAVIVLLSLCSQRVQYCKMVMDESVIPSLVYVTNNGNEKGKASAFELLRLLADIYKLDDIQESSRSDLDLSSNSMDRCEEKRLSPKASRIFGLKFSIFSKRRSSAPKKKK